MTPQQRGIIPGPELDRLRKALDAKASADQELRDAVVAAMVAGGSVREVAKVTGLSTRTVQDWGHAGGWPTRQQLATLAARRRKRAEFEARLRAVEAVHDDLPPDET